MKEFLGTFGEILANIALTNASIKESNGIKPLVVTRHGDQIVGGVIKTKDGGSLVLLPWVELYSEEFFVHGGDEIRENAELGYDILRRLQR